MTPIVLVSLQLIGIVVIVLAAWFLGKKLLGYPWSALGWGVLAFPLSQVFRFLLIYPVNLLWGAIFDAHTALIATTLTLIATSGLFEETTRWVVMRFWAKRTRAWRDGVGFGLGEEADVAEVIRSGWTPPTPRWTSPPSRRACAASSAGRR